MKTVETTASNQYSSLITYLKFRLSFLHQSLQWLNALCSQVQLLRQLLSIDDMLINTFYISIP